VGKKRIDDGEVAALGMCKVRISEGEREKGRKKNQRGAKSPRRQISKSLQGKIFWPKSEVVF